MSTISLVNRRSLLALGAATTAIAFASPALAQAPVLDSEAFWAEWAAFWNGDLDLAPQLVADNFKLNTVLLDGRPSSVIDGPVPFAQWVGGLHQVFENFHFETVAGPIAQTKGDDVLLAGHWLATGRYRGGFPGATAAPGTEFAFAGTDFIRIRNGQAVEYWLVSDTIALLSALGMA